MSREARLEHLRSIEEAGIDPYPVLLPQITHSCYDVVSNFEDFKGSLVTVAGRLMARRSHGGLMFYDLEDPSGRLQLLYSKSGPSDTKFDLIKANFDPGDIVAAAGEVTATKAKGEITVKVDEMTMLVKSLADLPEGKTVSEDRELARRRPYLDLLANPSSRTRFLRRSRMIQLLREELLYHGFLEVETPILDVTYGGALARPFVTHMRALDQQMYLRIANELYLKRLIVGNLGPVFEFSRNFRNEGIDRIHSPEFTAVELYKPFTDYQEMMGLAESTFEHIAVDLFGTTRVPFAEHLIDFKTPWARLGVYEGFTREFGQKPEDLSEEQLKNLAASEDLNPRYQTRDDLILALFEARVYAFLVQPTFVVDYPRSTSPLARRHRDNPNLAERFEGAVAGMKIMNGYSELNDPRDQQRMFEAEKVRRDQGEEGAMPFDEDFIRALEYGMPPLGGLGIGIDRMAMIFTNTSHIRDVILFPPVKMR